MELKHLEERQRAHPATPAGTKQLPTASTGVAHLLALQRSAGNRAVAGMLGSGGEGWVAVPGPAVSVQHRESTLSSRQPALAQPAAAASAVSNGRGLAADEGLAVNDRPGAGLLGAAIGGGVGAVAGGLLGGPLGALAGGLAGAAVGGGIGALLGGGGGAAAPNAPVPIAVRNGPGHRPIDTATAAGMSIDITLTSSSGVDADMATVQDSEQVSPSLNHTGSYLGEVPGPGNTSGYMPGHPIPPDRHSSGKAQIVNLADNHGGNGTQDFEQLDSFTAPAAGITTPQAVPASGYLIRRFITATGTEIKFRVEKSPRAVTVGGFTTTAGPSALQSDEVTVRP
ncbi:hypothetical protein [Georgenia sp. MJ170]|uniref:hypothetical protein n=1 Tax=Georgenia sunbinii TaxID=3117728 RepID=UPI002F265EAC